MFKLKNEEKRKNSDKKLTAAMKNINSTTLYNDLVERASRHKFLYHYTSLDTLKFILENKSLRLSSLCNVNDPQENKRISSLWNGKVFATCFTNSLDNADYFFRNYGKVRLTFSNKLLQSDIFFDSMLQSKMISFHTDCNSKSNFKHKGYDLPQDWCLFDKTFADIYYTNDLNLHISKDGYSLNAGLIKLKEGVDNKGVLCDWSIEKESRLRVAVRPIGFEAVRKGVYFEYPKPPFDYLYFSIAGLITKIELCNTCTIDEYELLNEITNQYDH